MAITLARPSVDDPDGCTRLQAGATLDVRDVEADLRTLGEVLVPGTRVLLDLGRVETVDTAGMQLLLALVREGARRGIPVQVANASAPLVRAQRLLGISLECGDAECPC